MSGVRVLEAGPSALLVELPCGEDAEAFHAELLRRRAAGELPVREIVPGARTVLLDGVEDRALAGRLRSWTVPPLDRGGGGCRDTRRLRRTRPRRRGRGLGVAVDEVPRLHARTEFRVAFCGFAPGFGYLTGLPGHLSVPRRTTPRTRVPAGALALAGPYTGVYPRTSPGGWQLIGRMPGPEALWDPGREPAALLGPGTRVRFVPAEVRG